MGRARRSWRTTCAALGALVALAAALGIVGCGRPAAVGAPEEDPTLIQEVLRLQEQRVSDARATVARLERQLRLVQMRRRMLERGGRHDLASALEVEEHALEQQLAHARSAAADEEDALAIYRQSGPARGGAG